MLKYRASNRPVDDGDREFIFQKLSELGRFTGLLILVHKDCFHFLLDYYRISVNIFIMFHYISLFSANYILLMHKCINALRFYLKPNLLMMGLKIWFSILENNFYNNA